MSWIQSVETNSNLPFVLKIVGIVLFALGFLASWTHIPVRFKFVMIIGIIAFFVGLRFVKIYSPTPKS
jgi:hypothetical protein